MKRFEQELPVQTVFYIGRETGVPKRKFSLYFLKTSGGKRCAESVLLTSGKVIRLYVILSGQSSKRLKV